MSDAYHNNYKLAIPYTAKVEICWNAKQIMCLGWWVSSLLP